MESRKYIEKTFHPKVHNPFHDYTSHLGYQNLDAIDSVAHSSNSLPKLNISESANDVSDKSPSLDYEDYDDTNEMLGPDFEVRRTLSLKSTRSAAGSPLSKGDKKVVRFADSLGLDLEVVRMYPDMDQPPPMDVVAATAMKALAAPNQLQSIMAAEPHDYESIAHPDITLPQPPPQLHKRVSEDRAAALASGGTVPQQSSSTSPSSNEQTISVGKSTTTEDSIPTTIHLFTRPHRKPPQPLTGPHNTSISPIKATDVAVITSPNLPFFPFGDYIYQQNMKNLMMMPTPLTQKLASSTSATHGTSNQPKNYFFSPYDHLSFPMRHIKIGTSLTGKYLYPTFPQPGKAYNFLKRVKDQKVCLEEITFKSDKCMISGLVRVENVSFHKTVYVRYTVDNWITQSDHMCTYVPGSTVTSPLYPPEAPTGTDSYENWRYSSPDPLSSSDIKTERLSPVPHSSAKLAGREKLSMDDKTTKCCSSPSYSNPSSLSKDPNSKPSQQGRTMPESRGANTPSGTCGETICTDKFTFDIVIPFSLSVGADMYLAIVYRTNGKEYWDNNQGRNYQLRCYAQPIKPDNKDASDDHQKRGGGDDRGGGGPPSGKPSNRSQTNSQSQSSNNNSQGSSKPSSSNDRSNLSDDSKGSRTIAIGNHGDGTICLSRPYFIERAIKWIQSATTFKQNNYNNNNDTLLLWFQQHRYCLHILALIMFGSRSIT